MDHFSTLVALAVLALSGASANAGYAQVTPPSGFSTNSAGGWAYKAAANETWVANTVRTSASLNVGGRAVTVPAAMRIAANSGRFAARFAFGNPALFVGVLAASAAYAWFTENQVELENGVWVKRQEGLCAVVTGCQRYSMNSLSIEVSSSSASGVCAAWISAANAKSPASPVSFYGSSESGCSFRNNASGTIGSLPIYKTGIPYDPGTTRPITLPEFEEIMAPQPVPQAVPKELPMDWPVERPVLNPTPGANPTPQPLRVPQGSPQPVPNTDPQQYKQPTVRVTPAPTSTDPWRVDVSPEDVVGTDPNGVTDPVTVTPGSPDGEPTQPDLCEKNPDILACAKPELNTPEADPLQTKDISLVVTPDSGWGASDAQCPAPRYIHPQGREIAIPFTLFCTYMSGLRPIIIALAWLAAGFIVVGFKGD